MGNSISTDSPTELIPWTKADAAPVTPREAEDLARLVAQIPPRDVAPTVEDIHSHTLEFLSKYSLVDLQSQRYFRKVFAVFDEESKGYMSLGQFQLALLSMMANAKFQKARLEYIMNLLELVLHDEKTDQSRAKLDRVSFNVFHLIASVVKRVDDLEDAVGSQIDALPPYLMRKTLARARRLFFMHVEGTNRHTVRLELPHHSIPKHDHGRSALRT